eukprot:gb/GFBE01081909.1/.p1 GENE.gb/GFBE01081909.1/~~gb/GFBE01081909.1/.p1  ORF type:complete len:173 (+),score=30.04 gb/GFBE01081909.1/:1-519(+)
MRKEMQAVHKHFMEWDRDGSGSLSKAEFRRILRACSLPPQNVEMIFSICDVNEDDEVSWNEFVQWVFGNHGQAGGRDTVNSRARAAIKNVASYRDSGLGQQTKTPFEILRARFPDKSETDIKDALLRADGHGGRAAAHLNGEIILTTSSSIGELGATMSGGVARGMRDLYGM